MISAWLEKNRLFQSSPAYTRAVHSTLLLVLAIAAAGLALDHPHIARAADVPAQRLLIAHYYPWYDMSAWTGGITPELPRDLYVSADSGVMARHFDEARGAGIDVFNVAWLGPNNPTDWNLSTMLPIAESKGISLTAGFETDSPWLNSRAAVVAGLRYLAGTQAGQPGYLRYEGRPVIFFWRLEAVPQEGQRSAVEAWRSIRDEVDPDREALWIGEGDRFEFLRVFDGIYPYSIAWSRNVAGTLGSYGARTRQQAAALGTSKLWVATVMPGYDDSLTGRSNTFARDRANGAFYDETWRAATGSDPDWIIITSWNEWVEGSQIEPSRSYGDTYLQMTGRWSDAWKGISAADARADEAAVAGGPSGLSDDVPVVADGEPRTNEG